MHRPPPHLAAFMVSWLLGATAYGQPRVDLTARVLTLPEMGTITNLVLITDQRGFAFMAPVGWRVEHRPDEGVIRMTSPKYTSIGVRRTPAPAEAGLGQDALRQRAQASVPNTRLVSEGTCHTEAETGRTFDFASVPGSAVRMRARLAFARVQDILFEFHFTATPEQFEADLPTFTAFLTTFQSIAPTRD